MKPRENAGAFPKAKELPEVYECGAGIFHALGGPGAVSPWPRSTRFPMLVQVQPGAFPLGSFSEIPCCSWAARPGIGKG